MDFQKVILIHVNYLPVHARKTAARTAVERKRRSQAAAMLSPSNIMRDVRRVIDDVIGWKDFFS
jgi:hypothetical protein